MILLFGDAPRCAPARMAVAELGVALPADDTRRPTTRESSWGWHFQRTKKEKKKTTPVT